MSEIARVDESFDGLNERDACAREDRQHNEETGNTFRSRASEDEGETKRNRSQCIAEVVDEISEQRNAQGTCVHVALNQGSDCQDNEADSHRSDAGPRAEDGRIDQAVRVAMRFVPMRALPMVVLVHMIDCVPVIEHRNG
jgi:hypothetical protein